MFKPNGSPVPALTQLGYWGSIHDFNDAVAQTHASYTAANGVPPDSKTMLGLAVQHPVGSLGKPLAVVSPVPTNGADVKGLLNKLVGAAGFGEDQRYQDFVHQHSDVLQGLLRDPATHAQTMAAFNASQVALRYRGANPDATPPSFTDVVKGGAHAVAWAADTSAALGKDLGSLLATTPDVLAGHTRKVDQAASFPHLTRAAPAVAQVVKGLAYSPVGVAMVAEALGKDSVDLSRYVATDGKEGSPAFNHTAKLAKATGLQMWQDLNDPGGRAGYLFLDVWGAFSLGAGTAARLGRVGGALGEEGSVASRVSGALSEARSTHPLKTVTYDKGGYTEQISLSGNPLAAWVQEHAPMLGTEKQQARLAGEPAFPAGPEGTPLQRPASPLPLPFAQHLNPLLDWSTDVLSPEGRMGRAGNIRRATETKALSALAGHITNAAGWAGRQTWLDKVLPDNHLTGLTRGEVKAVQALSWDVPGNPLAKIAGEEKFHQAMIELGFGDRAAHLEQIANLALARKAWDNPSARFQATLEATQKAVAEAQRIRLEHGLPEPVAEARVMKPGVIFQRAGEALDLQRALKAAAAKGEDTTQLEAELAKAKRAVETVDIYHVPEGYEPPAAAPSAGLGRETSRLESLQQQHAAALDREAAGLTQRQGRDLGPLSEADAAARLRELDARYDSLVKQLIPEVSPYGGKLSKQEQLRRNFDNTKARNPKQQKVSAEEYKLAEDKLLATIEENKGNATADRVAKIVDERNRLRDSLNARGEAAMSGETSAPLPRAPATSHRSVPPESNPQRDSVVRLGLALEEQQARVDSLTKGAATRHANAHPPAGSPPGFYTKVGDVWVEVNRQSDSSWYAPTVLKGKPKKQIGANVTLPASQYGVGPPGLTVWDTHKMTGDALIAGGIRIDEHNLAGEGLARTAKAAVQWDGWTEAWEHATEAKQSEGDIAIRDIRDVPDHIRKAVTEFQDGHISNDAVADLPAELHEYLFPREENIAPDEHVRYVDPRMLGDLVDVQMRLPGPVGKFFETINNTLRPLILYGPKYALNLLGNEGMLVFDQGFMRSSQNFAKAFSAKKWASAGDYAKLQSLAGATKSGSYVTAQSGRFSKGLADFWSRITDNNMRMASHLYYMDRAGFRTPEQIHDLLTNPEHAQTLVDITKRGDDAMVAFDRMSPFEKGVLRHIIFVYPWQRGSTIWSFRSVMEHPARTALLATLGQEAYTDNPWLAQVPAWVRRTGYIPFHWGGDKVSVLNPNSINTFGTLGQLMATAKGAVTGDPYAGLGDWFGPAGQLANHAASGVDANGNAYKGSQVWGAIQDTLNGLPEVASFRRNQKSAASKPLTPYDVAQRDTLLTRLNSALRETTLDPGWLDGYGSQLAGGFSPRHLSLTAVAARYWSTAPPKVKQQHEVDLILRQLALQAQFLKTGMPDDATITRMMLAPLGSMEVKGQVPKDVRQAVIDASQLAYSNQLDQKKLGRNWTAKEKLLNTIRYFRSAGRMSGATAKQLTTLAHSAEALPDLRHQEAAVHAKYGNLQALHDWGQDVSLAASFTQKANVDARTVMLNANGLAVQPTYMLTDAEREQYGRVYVKYVQGRRAAAVGLSGSAKTNALLAYDDAHAEPVKVGTRSLPSVAALRLSDGPSDVAQQAILKAVAKPWSSLSTVEKAALGHKIPAGVSDGWTLYRQSVKATRDAHGGVTADDRKQIASYVQKYYAGFMQDYLYAGKPKVERFQASPAYKTMPAKATFDQIAVSALAQARAMQTGQATHALARSDWKKYVVSTLQPWIAANHPELAAWLKPLGTNWLTGLINSG